MVMTMPDAIAILGPCAVTITAILAYIMKNKRGTNGGSKNGGSKFVREDVCNLKHEYLKTRLDEISVSLSGLKADIKQLSDKG